MTLKSEKIDNQGKRPLDHYIFGLSLPHFIKTTRRPNLLLLEERQINNDLNGGFHSARLFEFS